MLFPRELMLMILKEKSKLERRARIEYAKAQMFEKLKFPVDVTQNLNHYNCFSFRCGLHLWIVTDNGVFYNFKTAFGPIF